jgi:hypothetical protein
VQSSALGFTGAGRCSVRRAPILACALLASLASRAANADGAFPDSLSLFVSDDRPHRVALATNFGLISSNDDGATWTWVCEAPLTSCSNLYSVGAAPADRLYALSSGNLVYSDDDACHWAVASGAVSSGGVADAFPLAQDPARVLAVVSPNGVGPQTTYTVVASSDAGATFSSVLYTAASGDVVTGVEAARTDPKTIYLTIASAKGFAPLLAVTKDAGSTWRTVDLSPTLGQAGLRLIGVDRGNADRVFLRVSELPAEVLAIYDATTDGLTTPVSFTGGLMSAFLQTAEGPLLVAGRVNDASVVRRSVDGGASWQPVAGAPHLRALAERAGKIYGAADNMVDGFAIATSSDLGLTFAPLMKFSDVGSIAACVRATCQDVCKTEVDLGLWPLSMCTAAPEIKSKASSGCALGGGSGRSGLGALLVLAIAALTRRSRPH